ncbi:putative subtilisin-like protease [Ophiocordyceps camponoti-leonardi (nom. inval.)]|nr:putative subtilisin-like protease [Ophiocordyceps camponoti-leonardi (nom. inval.)]
MTSEALIRRCDRLLQLVANLEDMNKFEEVSSAICDPLTSLQAVLKTFRVEVVVLNKVQLVEASFQRCEEVLDGLERFLREAVVDPDHDGLLEALTSQRSELLDAANTTSLAMDVEFEYVNRLGVFQALPPLDPSHSTDLYSLKEGLAKTQLQNLKLGLDSISNMLFESAASVFSPARGRESNEGTFTAEEMDPLDIISPNSSTRRTICPNASFPRNMTRGKRIKSVKLNCLCDKAEGSHDNVLEYEVKAYTFLVEDVFHRSWRLCLHKPSLQKPVFLIISGMSSKDSEKLNDLWQVLTLQLASIKSKVANVPFNHLFRQGQTSQEALAAEIVYHKALPTVTGQMPQYAEIETPHGRMPFNGTPYLARLCHYFQIDAAIFAAEFEAFRNRLLQIWAQRPFGDEMEVYSREFIGTPVRPIDGARLRISVISSPSETEQSSLRLIMSKKGVPRWLCIDFENRAFRVVKRGLLESLDLVRLWMVEEDDNGKLIVYQTNWKKTMMMAQAVDTRRGSDLGGTQLTREQQQTSDEWEDRIESVKKALEESADVKGTYAKIKVCVIDTGFDPKNKNKSRIVSYRDFAEPKRTEMCDATHHGTFSANLVLSIYDDCELYVARVFKTDNTDGEREPELMAQAIEWAIASPQNVDIISISAGFSKHSSRVESAVQKASCANKLVFAAAANWGNKELVAFPARHALHTICIFATDVIAKASSFNPEGRERAHNFAVLGEGFPDPKDPRRQLKGTSMATAAAAGIAAFIVDFSRHRDNCRSIIRADDVGRMAGMIAVFDAISRPCGGYKCVSLSNLLPSNFDVKSWRPGEMRTYARQEISRAMDRAM